MQRKSSKCELAPGSKEFGSKLSWSNGHPNQRNAKTSVNASAANRVKVEPGNRTKRKSNEF